MASNFSNGDIIFIILTLISIFSGVIISYFRKYIPQVAYKLIFYGNLNYKSSEATSLQPVDIPKSSFRHFYCFASVFSCFCLLYEVLVYFFNVHVNEHVKIGLKVLAEQDEPVTVITALTAILLFTIQCWRRLYETVFMQVFSKSSQMNIFLYILSFLHYGLCITATVGKAPLFCGNQTRNNMTWMDINTGIIIIPCTLLFLWASYGQHHSHKILANLRKSRETGRVVTEAYRIPQGGLFIYTSSPHRLCEVLIYLAFALLLQTKTHVFIFTWVAANQIIYAIESQKWYKDTFKNYPSGRYAIFPYLF